MFSKKKHKAKKAIIWLITILLVIAMLPASGLAMAASAVIESEVVAPVATMLQEAPALQQSLNTETQVLLPQAQQQFGPMNVTNSPPAHVPVQAGDVRIENDSLRMDVGRLGQITRLNIVDMDLSRPQTLNQWREMNFVAGVHTFAANFRNSADHQWIGEMIFSTRSADTREGLANAGPFVEVDTNRTLQAGGRSTHNNPNNDDLVNPFFSREHDAGNNSIQVLFNPDSENMPTGQEPNPPGGNLNANMETGGVTAPRRSRIITDFQVESVFDADQDDDSILWSITITNPGERYIEFGDIGLPMLWNARFSRPNTGAGTPANNTEHVYDNSVIQHSFQGADSGFLKIMPPRGDNFLILAPVPQSGARIEYVDHWTNPNWGVANVHRPDMGIWRNDSGGGGAGDANNYNLHGMTVAYIHSSSIRNFTGSSYFHDTSRGATYFEDTDRFPARYNPVAPGTGFGGGGHPSGEEYTPLFTSLVLGPGESQTYEFRFHAVRGGDGSPEPYRGGRNNLMDTQNPEINHIMERETNMRTILHDMGLIDAVAVPSFQPAINMHTLLALRHDRTQVAINEVVIYCIHENDVFSDQHIPAWGSQAGRNRSRVTNTRGGRGLHNANPGFERSVIFREDLSGYDDNGEWVSIYELNFNCLGNNSVRVYYDLIDEEGDVIRPAFTQFEFNVLAELDELTSAHAEFLREQQQFWSENVMNYSGDNPRDHPLYGIFFDYHINTGITRIAELPVAIQNSIVTTPATPNARWGDDWSKGHGLFMSMAAYMEPRYEDIRSLETYLIDFMWNRYMANRHDSLLAPQWIATSPINNNMTQGDRFFGSAMIANTFFNMYRIQRAFPEMMEFRKDALFYLDVAAGMWDNGLRGGWGSSAGVAFYGEQQIEDIIQALHREGRTHRLNTFRGFFASTRTAMDFGTAWPFRSEFEYDNTTEEGLYARTVSMLRHFPNHPIINVDGEDRALRHMQIFNWSTRFKRGTIPTWYQYAVPTFRGGESWWNFQYTTSLAGHITDDWLRLRYEEHNWDAESIAWASRVNYAAKIGNFNHVNMGQISQNAIGASSVTYSMRKGTFGAQAVQISAAPIMHNGWHDMGMEAPLSLYGSLLSISTDVVYDPIFGAFAYGGDVISFDEERWVVQPTDGFGRRLNFLLERTYIESRNNRIAQASFVRDGSALELELVNLQGVPHIARVDTYGLTPGYYRILLDGAPAGQFYVHGADRNEGLTGVGPRRLEATAYIEVPTGDDFTVEFIRIETGSPVEPTVNINAQFETPWAGEQLYLDVQIIGDGSASVRSVNWEVLQMPEDAEVSFMAATPQLTGAAHTTGRRNSAWVDVDTSIQRNALMTPSVPGEYLVRVTVEKGNFTVSEDITITVINNPYQAAPLIIDTEYAQNANFISVSVDAQTFDRTNRELDFTWELISWPAGGQDAVIMVDDNATQLISMGIGAGYINRTGAMIVVPRGGVYTIRLTAADRSHEVYKYIVISAHGDFNIRAYNVVSQAGVLPTNLPATVEVPVAGEMQTLPVNWAIPDVSAFMVPGSVVELFGTVAVDEVTTISVATSVFLVADVETRINKAVTGTVFATWNNPGDLGGMTVVQRTNTPTGSANYSPAGTMGAWHNWGREASSERIEFTWAEPILLDRTDVFVMQNGAGSFRPFFDDLQVLTEAPSATRVNRPAGTPTTAANMVWLNENWETPRNLQGMDTANTLHQFNQITFEAMYVYGIALYLRPGAGPTGLGVGLLRWWPMGYEMEAVEAPVDVNLDELQILRDTAFEMGGGNIEGGGTPGTTARFANWNVYGAALDAARIAAEAVIANPTSQEQVNEATLVLVEAISMLVPVAPWEQPTPPVADANNIAFQALRSGSPPSPGQGHRINNINNNVAAGNWGTWGVGPLPSLNGSVAVPGGNFGVHWLQYDWPQGARIEQSNIRHWRDAFTGTGGVNTPSVLRFWYLPLDGDAWQMHTEWSRPELVEQIGNAGAQTWSQMPFEQPIYARAVRVELGRLATGTGNGVGVSQWQIFGALLEQQEAPGPFTAVHNTEVGQAAGSISPVSDAMEWRLGLTGEWQQIEANVTVLSGLANGNFYIRYSAVGSLAPSPSVRVEIRLQRSDYPTGLSSYPATAGLSDGIITGVTTAMEFSRNPDGPWQQVTGLVIAGLAEGAWYVRFAATDTYSPSLNTQVIVGTWEGEILPHEPPTNLSANPPSVVGGDDGDIRGVNSSMEWRAAGDEGWQPVVGIRISGLAAGTYHVRRAATPRNSASAYVEVIVPEGSKGGQAAPTGLRGVAPTAVSHNDGRIFGVNDTMEWSADQGTTWTQVEGTIIRNLSPGTYMVRRAETETHYASLYVAVEVPEAPPGADPLIFTGSNPNDLRIMLEEADSVILATVSGLTIFANHSPFIIPAGTTLTIETALNISGVGEGATLIVEGTLVINSGGRLNNQGGLSGGTIIVANGGRIVNNGNVDNLTNSTLRNNGTIVNNSGFDVRANATFINEGVVGGTTPITIHDGEPSARERLTNLVEHIETLERTDQPAAAWTRLMSALRAATTVLSNANASDAQFESALRNLETMYNAIN